MGIVKRSNYFYYSRDVAIIIKNAVLVAYTELCAVVKALFLVPH